VLGVFTVDRARDHADEALVNVRTDQGRHAKQRRLPSSPKSVLRSAAPEKEPPMLARLMAPMLAVVLLTAPANAITLEITSGISAYSSDANDYFGFLDGDGWHLEWVFAGGLTLGLPITVNGVTYLPPDPGAQNFGALLVQGVPPTTPPGVNTSEPFVFASFIDVLDPGLNPVRFDLVGQGVHTVEWFANDALFVVRDTFTARVVPEAPSAMLLTLALLTLAMLSISWRRHRRPST
jgi:hypothetical protein